MRGPQPGTISFIVRTRQKLECTGETPATAMGSPRSAYHFRPETGDPGSAMFLTPAFAYSITLVIISINSHSGASL
jgi:hypothetical protein